MKGMPRSELEDAIQEIFRGADGDGSGALDRAEFLRCLKVSGLGFTRRELNLILSEACLNLPSCKYSNTAMLVVSGRASPPLGDATRCNHLLQAIAFKPNTGASMRVDLV